MILHLSVLAQTEISVYDSVLAKRLGADEYGMKSYVLVILKTGSNNLGPGALRDSLFAGHLKNINRLADAGKLIIAGPMGDNENSYRGIFILNGVTISEAQELLKTDPVIKENVLGTDLYTWYGSAAISEYLEVHKRITKKGL
jgi:uncharacterized protein YciI